MWFLFLLVSGFIQKRETLLSLLYPLFCTPKEKKKLKCTLLNEAHTLPFGGLFMGGQLLDFRKEREDY